jgi:hypothetical protein
MFVPIETLLHLIRGDNRSVRDVLFRDLALEEGGVLL